MRLRPGALADELQGDRPAELVKTAWHHRMAGQAVKVITAVRVGPRPYSCLVSGRLSSAGLRRLTSKAGVAALRCHQHIIGAKKF